MKIVGIVGEMAAGKSFVAKAFKNNKIPIFDADQCIHKIYEKNSRIIHTIKKYINNVVSEGKIDRKILLNYLLANKNFLNILQNLLYPLFTEAFLQFVKHHFRIKSKIIVLDIPLLFETNAHYICNTVIYVKTKTYLRKSRILKRYNNNTLIFSLFPIKHGSVYERYCEFTINSGIEKVNIVSSVYSLIKKVAILQNRKINIHSYTSILISGRAKHIQNRQYKSM